MPEETSVKNFKCSFKIFFREHFSNEFKFNQILIFSESDKNIQKNIMIALELLMDKIDSINNLTEIFSINSIEELNEDENCNNK